MDHPGQRSRTKIVRALPCIDTAVVRRIVSAWRIRRTFAVFFARFVIAPSPAISSATPPALSIEWSTLQHDHERYERGLLLLKLLSVVLAGVSLVSGAGPLWMAFLVCVLWGQEAIFRTVQARLAARILQVEALIRDCAPASAACQLHSEWNATRGGTIALIGEYGRNALRPTVAFPHAVLILALLGMGALN